MRAAIEARLSIDAIDIYGLSEVMGPGVAQECIETKDGLTIWEDHFYPEVIDPATGEVLPEARKGSWSSHRSPRKRCPSCVTVRGPHASAAAQRALDAAMEKITGRSDDMMIIRGVNVFPTQIEELILKQPALAPHYQLEITRPGALDELTVLVERAPAAGSADGDAAGAALAHLIKNLVGVTAAVRVMPAGCDRALAGQGSAGRRQALALTPREGSRPKLSGFGWRSCRAHLIRPISSMNISLSSIGASD
jgi:phenylacetate-CoA ligase